MSIKIREEGIRFIKDYYKTLTRMPKSLTKFYNASSKISVNFEGEEPSTAETSNQTFALLFKKKVEKVLISSVESQELNSLLLINVVGQFCNPGMNLRFTHTFVVDAKIIKNEICWILDEEVVYEERKGRGRIRIAGGDELTREKIFELIGKFGKINTVECKGAEWVVEFFRAEDAKRVISEGVSGLRIEIVYPRD